jgi:hypothetical protein
LLFSILQSTLEGLPAGCVELQRTHRNQRLTGRDRVTEAYVNAVDNITGRGSQPD